MTQQVISIAAESLTLGFGSIIGIAGLIYGIWQGITARRDRQCAAEKAIEAEIKADKEKEDARQRAAEDRAAAVKAAAEAAAKTQGREDGVMLTQLGAANKGISDIQSDIRRMEEKRETQHLELSVGLTATKESVASAHHRIDTLEEIVNAIPKKKE